MWFAILGHLAVRRPDGAEVPIPGPARRQLLAALLCRPGAIVTTSTLVEDLWGSAPPRTAVSTLRSHVLRLRAALAQGGGENLLLTVDDGYRLDIASSDVDAGRFEALVDEAARASDPTAALERYDAALALWRDEPYVEFGDAPFAVLERIRLTELRALARERRTDLALASGTAAQLVGDLEQRVQAEPYRERGWEQLALAFYRSGRQADALAACRRARQVLLDDLGVDPGPGLQTLEQRLLRQDPELMATAPPAVTTTTVINRCPYLGLAGYEEQDAALFVGRERLTSTLASRLADQSVVVVTGASGVGKSSLVRAGLVPALRSGALPGSSAWRIDVQTPSASVLSETQRRPDLLVLDQAEELFTDLVPASREDLLRRLARYVDGDQGRVVLVLRSDFYGRLADLASLAPYAEKAAVLVGPMRADELRRALVEPAARAGLRLEDELIETIMDDVAGQPEPLPLLSEAMVRTWERREGDLLTLDGYERSGELAGALEAAAEECYGRLDETRQRAARQLLVRMATRTDTGWVRRKLARPGQLGEAEEQALAALVAARLVVADEKHVEIGHEALLVHWPRLRGWLDERSRVAELLEHLERAAATWQASGRQEADLYRGPRLAAALDWRAEHEHELASDEVEFLDAAERFASRELMLAQQQVAREAHGRRRLRRVVIALAVVIALVVAAAAVAAYERSTARSQAARARQAALTADARKVASEALTAPDLRTSLLLAAAAYRMQDSPETRSSLLSTIERFGAPQYRIPTENRPQWVGVNTDGSTLWETDNLRQVIRYDTRARKQIGTFPLRADHVVAMSPDARLVVAVGQANFGDKAGATRAIVLDATTGDIVRILPIAAVRNGTAVRSAAFTSDGRYLAIIEAHAADAATEAGSSFGTAEPDTPTNVVALFDAHRLDAKPRELRLSAPAVAVAASRQRIAIQTADGALSVIDPAKNLASAVSGVRPELRIAADQIAAGPPMPPLDVTADGQHLAVVNGNNVELLDARHLSEPAHAIATMSSPVASLSFSPAGDLLAVGTSSGEVDLLRVADGSIAYRETANHGQVMSVVWSGRSAQDEMLYAGGLDSQLVAFDVRQASRQLRFTQPLEEGTGYLHYVAGELIGTRPDEGAGPESALRLWIADPVTGSSRSFPLGLKDDDEQSGISVDNGGRYVLVTVQHTNSGLVTCRLYDLASGRLVSQFQPTPERSSHFSFSGVLRPDGHTAVVSTGPRTLATFAIPSGKRLSTTTMSFRGPSADRIYAIPQAFAPDGDLLVWGFDSGRARSLALPGPSTLHLPPRADPPQKQQFELVDPVTGADHGDIVLGATDFYGAPTWSPDGRRLALATMAGTLTILDAHTMRPIADRVPAVAGDVNDVAFSPDGKTIVTGGSDGEFSLWDANSGQRIGPPIQTGGDSVYVWFDTHGDLYGYTEYVDKNQQRKFSYPGDPREWLTTACATAGGDLTATEWAQYVTDRPYRRTCG